MAFAHGKDSVLLITDAAATEQDISKYFDNIPPAISRAMSEVSAFGDKGQRFIPGLQGASFDVEGHFDPAIHTILSGLFDKEDAPTQLVFGPAGSAVGMPKMSMDCWVSAYNVTAPVGEKVSISATIQMDGHVTWGTF